jgi:hypothetical protein
MKALRSAFAGAVILGGVGFAAGFFGPIIFTPEANQGPLLGIFITGPLGCILGFVLGGLYGAWRQRRRTPPPLRNGEEIEPR